VVIRPNSTIHTKNTAQSMTKGNEENRTTATTNWRVTGDRPATDLWLM